MRIVLKFGGSSLADLQKLRLAARRVQQEWAKGNQVVAVVSAQGDTTDRMIEEALLVTPQPSLREMDAYLSTAEQRSAALMAMSLQDLDCPAISLTGMQAGLLTDGVYGNARVEKLANDRILREWDKGNVVIVAGFQGWTVGEDVATLGRGGSDTTAVALAAFLQAEVCRIYTDVDGVYDKDPRKFPDAERYSIISYRKMLAMAQQGAQVLHDRCVELAMAQGVVIHVVSSFREGDGTWVTETKM